MDALLADGGIGGGGGSRAKDAALAKAMFEGTQEHRRKLKMPEMSDAAEKIKEEAEDESFFAFFEEDDVGRYYFCRFLVDVHPVHGNFLLLANRYRSNAHEKRKIADDVIPSFVQTVTDLYSSEDADTIIEAYEAGKKPQPKPGKKSRRQNALKNKIEEAKKVQVDTSARLNKSGTVPDLLDDMVSMMKDDLEEYYSAFKQSKYVDLYARARSMELQNVTDDDFHQFRILGVGGFGSVYAAVKKDTGALVAIKRMDKKLIKHKNRYKSCFTEVTALRAVSSKFVCGLHYTFQSRDDVCLALDLLHGGTLSYLLHQKKKVSERYVHFFTACIVMAYEALHTKGFVYRDMKPANVLIKDNGYCVLIDFGLAAKMDTALKGKCGTRGYWAPEMVKGDQYLASGDWWSLGVTLVELLTGKKPFKKKFQKYKNTDDKIKLCKAGDIADVIEERNIEQKLGKAVEEDDDGRDSNDEETDDEEEEEAAKKATAGGRRSSIRVIGGFDKQIESIVETDAGLEFWDELMKEERNAPLKAIDAIDGGAARLLRMMSLVTFDGEAEVMISGEYATFVCVVLEGKLRSDDGVTYESGAIVGAEGLFKDNFHRPVKIIGGIQGGSLGIFLYSELARADQFDNEVLGVLKGMLIENFGGGADAAEALPKLQASFDEFADMEGTHAEERYLATLKHSKKADDAAAAAKKMAELSSSKQRDQKIYLTQEVWAKKELIGKTAGKFVSGLLTRDVNKRLGCGPGGFRNIKEHDWYEEAGFDWDQLEEGNLIAPYVPKKEVNAKDESKMKTFNTAGMKKLNKEDQDMWKDWDWTSVSYFRTEMAAYLYEQWGLHEYRKGGGGGGGGGCCEIS